MRAREQTLRILRCIPIHLEIISFYVSVTLNGVKGLFWLSASTQNDKKEGIKVKRHIFVLALKREGDNIHNSETKINTKITPKSRTIFRISG